MEIVFPEHPDILGVALCHWNLAVCVGWKGQHMDCLLDLDVSAIKTYQGYQCRLCELPRETWPTLETLYEDHLYEPFLKWANEKLRCASEIAIYAIQGGTWAKLHFAGQELTELKYLQARFPINEARQ